MSCPVVVDVNNNSTALLKSFLTDFSISENISYLEVSKLIMFLINIDFVFEKWNNDGNSRFPQISICLINQGSQVRFPASPSLSDETLSRCPVF